MKEERVHKGASESDRGGEGSDADSDGEGDGGGAGDGRGDGTDDGGEDDDDGEDLPVGRRPLGARGDRHKCRNETHRRPKLFSSSIEKLRHIISKHNSMTLLFWPFIPIFLLSDLTWFSLLLL